MSTGTQHLLADLRRCMTEDVFTDVRLEGTDGQSVHASFVILAMRSEVFKRLRAGNSSNTSALQVHRMPFNSRVLYAVKHYCYTDELAPYGAQEVEEKARDAVRIMAASRLLELPGLETISFDYVCVLMKQYPHVSLIVFDEVVSGNANHEQLRTAALSIIRANAKQILLASGESQREKVAASSLSEEAISILIGENEAHLDDFKRFRCLKVWSDAEKEMAQQDEGREDQDLINQISSALSFMSFHQDQAEDHPRLTVARTLTKEINLSKIPPSELSGYVANSGLVSPEQLAVAFKEQALLAETKGVSFGRKRSGAPGGTKGTGVEV